MNKADLPFCEGEFKRVEEILVPSYFFSFLFFFGTINGRVRFECVESRETQATEDYSNTRD